MATANTSQARLEESIRALREENNMHQNKIDSLKQETNNLKTLASKHELQEELVKDLKLQRESLLKEIEKLRVTNQ